MGFDWGVSISLQYCVPIKLDDKVSFWTETTCPNKSLALRNERIKLPLPKTQ